MRKAAREWEGITLLNKHIDCDSIDIFMALGGKCEGQTDFMAQSEERNEKRASF